MDWPIAKFLQTVGQDKWHHRIGRFQCHCGKKFTALELSVRPGHQVSCGCWIRNPQHPSRYIHGETNTKEYHCWNGMMQRCYREDHISYKYYGGRGITVFKRWHKYRNFLADMGRKPSDNYSIDRIDVNGNYTPNNCRWVTLDVQARNKRRSHQKSKKA